jgi:hypothetical protein
LALARTHFIFVAQLLILGITAPAALVLPGVAWVRQTYGERFYPPVQATVTAWSNQTRTSLFDVTIIVAMGLLLGGWGWWVWSARRHRSAWPVVRGLLGTATAATVVYLWFLLAWGLNYARAPIESIVPFDTGRVTTIAVRALAEHAVRQANLTHAAAHQAGFPALDSVPPALASALHEVEREFGRQRATVLAHPKRSLLSPFFRASGVSGMLGPFFLETLLNPDLTGPERPFVLAHEWAHLAGFAPEADASFVGILASLRADTPAQYSAWLELVSEASNQLQPVTRGLVLAELAPGPRADREAINERLKALVRPVERAAWATYDRALKSQGVAEGVQSYSRVVQLLLGTNALKVAS